MLYGTPDRESAWQRLAENWDLIVIGGGITGAGILREGVRVGLKVLLLEQNDFSSGTSSRSSKMVHGGLRYLNNMQFRMTFQSVCERETLLKQGPGLVEPLPFIYPVREGDKVPGWMMDFGLRMYGWMGGKWKIHKKLKASAVQEMVPGLFSDTILGGFRFFDALTDDARLVLRVIREGVATGCATALNYARVEGLLRNERGRVVGVTVRDQATGRTFEAQAGAVVNATGAWVDNLRVEVGARQRIRPLRGSHLMFDADRLPLREAVSFTHPDDGRPVFAFPWEGVTLLGTTDLDHREDLNAEPRITQEEVDYLLRAMVVNFPALNLTTADVVSTFAGVRPVVGHGDNVEPSKESREHVLWKEKGLLTVTGGKLTTFRCIALDALRALRPQLPKMEKVDDDMTALDPPPEITRIPEGLTEDETRRLVARYGPDILTFVEERPPEELARLDNLPIHWLEFRWAARHEAVLNLKDLLLRRLRLGLIARCGGEKHLPTIRKMAQEELGWDDARWEKEADGYIAHWQAYHSVPGA